MYLAVPIHHLRLTASFDGHNWHHEFWTFRNNKKKNIGNSNNDKDHFDDNDEDNNGNNNDDNDDDSDDVGDKNNDDWCGHIKLVWSSPTDRTHSFL